MNISWSLWMNCATCLFLAIIPALLAEGDADCSPISSNELRDYVSEGRFGGEGLEGEKVTLLEYKASCVVVGSMKGLTRQQTITVRYTNPTNNDAEEYGRIRLLCVTQGDATDWSSQDFDRVFDSSDGSQLLMAETNFNCSSCGGTSSGFTGDYECVACPSACNVGQGYCNSDGCCSYYDDGNCVADCTGNQHPNSTFDCVCDEFYQETQCTTCILQLSDCFNGGLNNINTCECDCQGTGYTGKLCTDDIDECETDNPCTPGQSESCINKNGTYQCVCIDGYNGMTCENNIDDCAGDPCRHGGTCTDGVASFSCSCAPGYTGNLCQTDIDECASDPCQHGGTCSDRVNDYVCTCIEQYTGKSCETDVDECVTIAPCLNEGRCINSDGGYSCDCVGKWTNAHCDLCVIDNCVRTNCTGPRYECLTCIESYTPIHPNNDGCVLCTIDNCTSCDIDGMCQECAFNLVSNGTACIPREPKTRVSALEIGHIFAIIIGLGVLIGIIVVVIVILVAASLRIRASKPIQMVVKNPMENKDPIVLQKHTEL